MFDTPKDVLKLWIESVNSRSLKNVLDLYDETAILLPTFSNKFFHDPEGIKSYFEKISSHKDLLVKLHDNTLTVQDLSNGLYALSGIYCWRFEVDGEVLNFEARFTFVINIKSSAPIIHHHSSQIPRML